MLRIVTLTILIFVIYFDNQSILISNYYLRKQAMENE